MTDFGKLPNISAVQWLSAKEVLGGEASDLTPWLLRAESMQILGGALKLEDLTGVTARLTRARRRYRYAGLAPSSGPHVNGTFRIGVRSGDVLGPCR